MDVESPTPIQMAVACCERGYCFRRAPPSGLSFCLLPGLTAGQNALPFAPNQSGFPLFSQSCTQVCPGPAHGRDPFCFECRAGSAAVGPYGRGLCPRRTRPTRAQPSLPNRPHCQKPVRQHQGNHRASSLAGYRRLAERAHGHVGRGGPVGRRGCQEWLPAAATYQNVMLERSRNISRAVVNPIDWITIAHEMLRLRSSMTFFFTP